MEDLIPLNDVKESLYGCSLCRKHFSWQGRDIEESFNKNCNRVNQCLLIEFTVCTNTMDSTVSFLLKKFIL